MSKTGKITKGQHLYIKTRKRAQLTRTILMFGIAAAIYMVGLALNKWENTNVFTVIAALWVLPSTKILVNYIVLFPYKSVSEERYQSVVHLMKETDTLYSDVVFTSPEKVMNLDFLVLRKNQLIGLCGNKKQDVSYMEAYLRDSLKKRAFAVNVLVTNDEKAWMKTLTDKSAEDLPEDEKIRLQEFLLSLMV